MGGECGGSSGGCGGATGDSNKEPHSKKNIAELAAVMGTMLPLTRGQRRGVKETQEA